MELRPVETLQQAHAPSGPHVEAGMEDAAHLSWACFSTQPISSMQTSGSHVDACGQRASPDTSCTLCFGGNSVRPCLCWQAARLDRAWERESGRFQHDYNDRLLAGLVGLSLLDILVFRFLMRVAVLEDAGLAWPSPSCR